MYTYYIYIYNNKLYIYNIIINSVHMLAMLSECVHNPTLHSRQAYVDI